MSCQISLNQILTPKNVLKCAEEKLLAFGGTPFGKDSELDALIQNLAKPIIERSSGKTPEDFYKSNVTVLTPHNQIKSKALGFARRILRENCETIQAFSKGQSDSEVLEKVALVITDTIADLTRDYFVQLYDIRSKQS